MKTALVIMDMQKGNFGQGGIENAEKLITEVEKAMESARKLGYTIVFVKNQGPIGEVDEPGTAGYELIEQLKPQEKEITIEKKTPDAFLDTDLLKVLTELQIKKLIFCGLQTEYCVDTTIRKAWSLGFKVQLLESAHSTWHSKLLTADQIIQHHNRVLGEFFAEVIKKVGN